VLNVKYSLVDVGHIIKKACVQDNADSGGDSYVQFVSQLKDWLCGAESNKDFPHEQQAQIIGNIVNANNDGNNFSCSIWFGNSHFSIKQTSADATIVICALDMYGNEIGEAVPLEGITFPELQIHMLKMYVETQRTEGRSSIDWCPFNFSKLTKDILIGISIDNFTANSLIEAGADLKLVVASFLASKPCSESELYKSALLRQIQETERKQHKANMLEKYLDVKRVADRLPINLSELDLSDVNFEGLNLAGTTLSSDNLNAIIAGGGNLTGATLADEVTNINVHYLDEVKIDKSMANQLIKAGANPKIVLLKYIATERSLNKKNIDISGMDLSRVDVRGIDLHDVDTAGILFAQTPVSNLSDKMEVQASFRRDLVAMLTVFSKTVAETILHSSTRDKENKVAQNIYMAHQSLLKEWVWQNGQNIPRSIESVLKYSTGNCGEMAGMCKSMCDLYLKESLVLLGYHDVSITAIFVYAKQPSDHAAVYLSCSFNGIAGKYLIDPWIGGKAWPYQEGMDYLRTGKSAIFTNSTTTFETHEEINRILDKDEYHEFVNDIFDQFNVAEQLYSTIKKHQSNFVGMPLV
jgi:uncharacterized protein YjbI with pentapeptide repeats